jgi:hypothetical protein
MEKERKVYSDEIVDLSGTPINELQVWKIMEISNIPFNSFDLFDLLRHNIFLNPYTREYLPIDQIRIKENFLKSILCEHQLCNFNLINVVRESPLLSKESILKNKILNDIWNKLTFPPSIELLLGASDRNIDNMVDKLYYCCMESFILYPMCTKTNKRNILISSGINKKMEFVDLLSSILNYDDEHADIRLLMVTLLFRHFDRSIEDGDWLHEHFTMFDSYEIDYF